jgi:DNA-binding NarL/FixJ family response regulator
MFPALPRMPLAANSPTPDRLEEEAERAGAQPRLAQSHVRPHIAPVRILIVEDHVMFREVLRKVCVEELQHEVVGEAGDGACAVALVAKTQPDLLLLDLHLPSLDGFAVVEEARKHTPHIKVLVLSSHCDEFTVFRAERARVQGFVDKNTNSVAMLKAAIAQVAEGKVWFSEAFRRVKTARHNDPKSFDKLLTDRERAVLALVGEPLTDAEISAQLGIAGETVEKHRFNILRKLELQTTTELVRYAREHGFTLTARPGSEGALLP